MRSARSSDPEVRTALTRQTTGQAEELVGSVRTSAVGGDDRVERAVRRRERPETVYAGVATRALGFAVDAGGSSSSRSPPWPPSSRSSPRSSGRCARSGSWACCCASGWALYAGGYFVLFWSSTGQTPGMRLFRLRVSGRNGRPPSAWRAVLRAVGTVIAIVPLFAGYVPVLFDERRRGLPDFLAGTFVVYDDRIPRDRPSHQTLISARTIDVRCGSWSSRTSSRWRACSAGAWSRRATPPTSPGPATTRSGWPRRSSTTRSCST